MASFRSLSPSTPRAEQVVNHKDRGQMPSFLHNAIQDILNRYPHLRARPAMSTTVGDLSDLAPTTLGAIRPELLLQRKYQETLPAYQRRMAGIGRTTSIIPGTFLSYLTSPHQSRTESPPLASPATPRGCCHDDHQPATPTQNPPTVRGLPEIERDVQNRTRQLREAMHLVVDLEAKLLELELEQRALTPPTKKKQRKSRAEKRADWENNKGNGQSKGLVIMCGIASALAIVALVWWITMSKVVVPDSNHVQVTTTKLRIATTSPNATTTAAPVSETDVAMRKICNASERITRLPSAAGVGAGIAQWPTLFEVLALDVGAPPFTNRPDGEDVDDARFVDVGKQEEAQREMILRARDVIMERNRIEREAVASAPLLADEDENNDDDILAQVMDTLLDDAARARYVWEVLPRMREVAAGASGGGWMANTRPAEEEGTPAHRRKMMEALVQMCAGHGVVLGEA